jgi:hypothetical protein
MESFIKKIGLSERIMRVGAGVHTVQIGMSVEEQV